MVKKFFRHLAVAALAGSLAMAALPTAFSMAAPSAPTFTISDKTDQAGTYDGTTAFNSGWFNLQITNPGTSTYTQVILKVYVSSAATTPNVVARFADDGSVGTPTDLSGTNPACTRYNKLDQVESNPENGWYFVCTWSSNVDAGTSTSPVRFVFANKDLINFNVNADVTVKAKTTAGSGQNSFTYTSSNLIKMAASARDDQEGWYVHSTTSPLTLSTWKKGNSGQLTSATLPASSTGYKAYLADYAVGAISTPCGSSYDGAVATSGAQITKMAINGGANISPYFQVALKMTWAKGSTVPDISTASVKWCIDNPADALYGQVVTITAANACVDNDHNGQYDTAPCWVSSKVQGNTQMTTWTITVVLPHNGYVKIG